MNFAERRAMALAILNQVDGLSRQAGSFLGQCAVDQNPLSEKQERWFDQLVERFEQAAGGVQ